ncbi:MAG: hypothetical protein AAB690_00295 [Patescibacteria group bacterium]
MRELERKQRTRRIIYSTPALVAIALVVIILARGAWGAVEKEKESGARVRELNGKAISLEGRQAELEEDISRLNTEAGMAEEIRSKFNVAEEGEYFVVLVEPGENKVSTSSDSRPWYEKWWSIVKNLR